MALSSQIIKTVYAPDGAQTLYAVVFPLFSPQDVQCFAVDAAGRESEITDFTVEGFGTESGVYVRFAAPPAAGSSLVLRRNTRQVQETAYPEGGKFPSAVVENDLDRIVGMIQELDDGLARSLKVNVGEEAPPESAEELYLRVQEVLADAEGARDFSQANAASANQSAVSAAASRDAAAGSAADAAGSAAEAHQWALQSEALGAAQAELARRWAENPEGAAVIPEHYSAFHWAQKARQNAAEGVTVSDSLSGTGTALEGVAASEWALAQVNDKAEDAGEAAAAAMEAAKKAADEAALPLFSLVPCPTGIIRPGFLFPHLDNGLLTRAAFPQAYRQLVDDAVAGSTAILLGDAAWQAEKLANGGVCPRFMLDEEAETFRIPYTPGLYQREPDPGKGAKAGDYQIDTMRPITGTYSVQANSPVTSGAFYQVAGSGAYGSQFDGNRLAFNSALLGPNYSGDETRPATGVEPRMMKMYGAVVDASEANIAALIQTTTGKLDASEFNKIPFRRRWISDGIPVVATSPFSFSANHNLNLSDTSNVFAQVKMRCKIANNGYSVGDYATFTMKSANEFPVEIEPIVTANSISATLSAFGLLSVGTLAWAGYLHNNATLAANWEMVFIIHY